MIFNVNYDEVKFDKTNEIMITDLNKFTIRTNKIKTPNLRSLTAIITRPFAK